jgi:D-alanine-D-alanine ligase
MRLGLTYDLREAYPALGLAEDEAAEFESPHTIDAIADALVSLGHETDRIGHIRDLAARLVRGDRWDLVFNMAEGVSGAGREAQVPALLEAYDIPYTFSDPLTLSVALHKGMAKRVVRDSGIPTPAFAIVDDLTDIDEIDLPFPLFAKPVAEGSSKGVSHASIVGSRAALISICRTLVERYRQPVLVEQFLPGREFTVGIVGEGRDAAALGAMEIHLGEYAEQGVYSRSNKAAWQGRVTYSLVEPPLVDEAVDVALGAWRALGCRDAGRVDVRCDGSGRVNFLEVNPLAGLDPIAGDLVVLCGLNGIGYRDLMAMIIARARDRSEAARARTPRSGATMGGTVDVTGR